MLELRNKLNKSHLTVAFTGAGISVPSGNPTLEAEYYGLSLDSILSIDYFRQNKLHFYEIYKKLIKWTEAEPNNAHIALKKLDIPIITQNIDGLHTKAGSKRVIELHGNLDFLCCEKCSFKIESKDIFSNKCDDKDLLDLIECPICGDDLRPDLVFFGETIKNFHTALNEIHKADLLLVIGNSLRVWPANQIVRRALMNNCEVYYIVKDCDEVFNFI